MGHKYELRHTAEVIFEEGRTNIQQLNRDLHGKDAQLKETEKHQHNETKRQTEHSRLTGLQLGRLGGGDGLAQHGVQLHHFLVLDAPHVRGVGVRAGARHVAQLAAQRRGPAGPRAASATRRRQLNGRLLLLVLLSLEMFLVCLRTGARDAAHVAVVELLRLRRRLGATRLARTRSAGLIVLPATEENN